MPRVVARLYANNELTLDFQETVSRRKPTDNRDRQRKERIGDELQWINYLKYCLDNFPDSPKVPIVQEDSVTWVDRTDVLRRIKYLEESLSDPLDLMKKSQEDKNCSKVVTVRDREITLPVSNRGHSKWGKQQSVKRFSRLGRHTLIEAGSVFDVDPYLRTLHKGYIVTLTIPGDTQAVFKLVADWSGYIWNRLSQVIRDYEKIEGKSAVYWFRVWELQKRGALHLHIYINANNSDIAKEMSHKIKDKWYEVCDDICSKHGVDFYVNKWGKSWRNHPNKWQWDIQPVKKSVGAYFSKYASKGNRQVDTPVESKTPVYYPSRWWSVSKSVMNYINDYRVKIEYDYANQDELIQILVELSQWTNQAKNSLYREYRVTTEDRVLCCGERFTWFFEPSSWLEVHHRIYIDCLKFYEEAQRSFRRQRARVEMNAIKKVSQRRGNSGVNSC